MSSQFSVSYTLEDCWIKPAYTFQDLDTHQKNLFDQVSDTELDEEIQGILKDLQEWHSSFQDSLDKLLDIQRVYINAVDVSLSKRELFKYKKQEEELSLFVELLRYCRRSNNFYLMRKWFVDFPNKETGASPIIKTEVYEEMAKRLLQDSTELKRWNFGYQALPIISAFLDALNALKIDKKLNEVKQNRKKTLPSLVSYLMTLLSPA